ncbi:MAG TPA: hypothetical protein VGN23_10550 [Verrucomicrobiae bacterium]|jgi:hypothetical protein
MGTTFYIAVEDDLSDAVVRRLLNHVRRGFQVRARYPLSPLSYFKPELSGYGYLKTNIQAFNAAAVETSHLLLTDLDISPCALELIQDWAGGDLHPNFIFRVAVREVEGWLLADRDNFADFLGLNTAQIPANVEAIAQAKEEIVNLARLSPNDEIRDNLVPRVGSTATTGRLFTRTLIGYVRNFWEIEEAANNANSLARALRALHTFKPV